MSTSDHWHCPASILACDAGKHVYVEKPVSHNVREGRLLVEAAERNKVVVQHGTQSRSTDHVRKAMEVLQSGAIGEVLVSKAWNSQKRGTIGKSKPQEPPAYLDFELWLGPAPKVAYRPNMLPGIWRWWYDFGCGDIGNDGSPDLAAHHRNFLAAVRGEAKVRADALTAHLSSSLCHLGNIAVRTGRVLNFDPAREQVLGDEESNALVRRKYSGHWGVPKGV